MSSSPSSDRSPEAEAGPVTLALPRSFWEEGLRRLLGGGSNFLQGADFLHCPLHVSALPERLELLAGEAPERGETSSSDRSLSFALASSSAETQRRREEWQREEAPSTGDALLVSGVEARRGHLGAWVHLGGEDRPVVSVRLPGRGMHRVVTGPSARASEREEELPPQRWSRTIGALGEESWRRLAGLRVGLIGCGRLGSLLAQGLARTGVSNWVLVDPDSVERHNLGESAGLTEEDMGHPKAEALARHLQERCLWVEEIRAVPHSVTMEPARRALRACDVLLCCVDMGSGRLAAGLLAALYHLPLIDVGTGVFDSEGRTDIGAEVRLVLPGDSCLRCLGDTAQPEEDRRLLRSPDAERAAARSREWTDERSGSLRSWNTVAAGVAQRALESLVTEEIGESTWWRLRWRGAALEVRRRVMESTGEECFCPFAGEGDEGISHVQVQLREGY